MIKINESKIKYFRDRTKKNLELMIFQILQYDGKKSNLNIILKMIFTNGSIKELEEVLQKKIINFIKNDNIFSKEEISYLLKETNHDLFLYFITGNLINNEDLINELLILNKERQNKLFKIILNNPEIDGLKKIFLKNEAIKKLNPEIATVIKDSDKDLTGLAKLEQEIKPCKIIYKNTFNYILMIKKIMDINLLNSSSGSAFLDCCEDINQDGEVISSNYLKKYNSLFISSFSNDISFKNRSILKLHSEIDSNMLFYENIVSSQYYKEITKNLSIGNNYIAMTNSILFMENFLRKELKRQTGIDQKYKNKKQKDEEYLINDFCKKNKINDEIKSKYIEELKEKNVKNFNANSSLFKELLSYSKERNLITEEEYVGLNFLLLNDKNEGLNLRNNIFHAFKTEADYEGLEHIFSFVSIYILGIIMNYCLKKGGCCFDLKVFKIKKDSRVLIERV